MTHKIYLENTWQFDFEGEIQKVEIDERGLFITLNQTAFYPQGGGQPSDKGTIKSDYFEGEIAHVVQRNEHIRHYLTLENPQMLIVGSKIRGFLQKERRILNARYHTAGHLLGNVVEILNPKLKAVKGHSFPGEAYVEFQGEQDQSIEITILQNTINRAILEDAKIKVFETSYEEFEETFYKLPYGLPLSKKLRALQIGDMMPVPCGGTHLSCLQEIGQLKINKMRTKNDYIRISYEVI